MRWLIGISLLLAGCQSAEPVTIPQDLVAAAPVCAAVYALYNGQTMQENDLLTVEQLSQIMQFGMIAAAQGNEFSQTMERVSQQMQTEVTRIQPMDWRGALDACDSAFGLLKSPDPLPANDFDAAAQCFAVVDVFEGAARGANAQPAAAVSDYTGLVTQLQAYVDDPANSRGLSDADYRARVTAAARVGYAAGNPLAFVARCKQRFP